MLSSYPYSPAPAPPSGQSDASAFTHHHRRPRGKSILQSIALNTANSKSLQYQPNETQRRRTLSVGSSFAGPKPRETSSKDSSEYLLYPFTSQELQCIAPIPGNTQHEEDVETSLKTLHEPWYKFVELCDVNVDFCSKLVLQTKELQSMLSSLSGKLDQVYEETDAFQNVCGRLMRDQDTLAGLQQELGDQLQYFDCVDSIVKQLNSPGSKFVTGPAFLQLLQQLDRCLQFTKTHPKYRHVELYDSRFQQCMARALSLINSYVSQELKALGADVSAKLKAVQQLNSTTQDALLYTSFSGSRQAPVILQLTSELAARAQDSEEYSSLLTECYDCYINLRSRLLLPVIRKTVAESAANASNLVLFAQKQINYVMKVCRDERELFLHFFAQGEAELYKLYYQLSEPLNDALRNRIIREVKISTLCELTSILQRIMEDDEDATEFSIEEQNNIKFGQVFTPVYQDVQARLVFRVQAFVDESILNYVPQMADLHLGARKTRKGSVDEKTGNVGSTKREDSVSDVAGLDSMHLFQGWYPPMSLALSLLSSIYQLVNSSVFDDLAHQIVHYSILSLQKGFDLYASKVGKPEAYLFLIKHLVFLRDQIQSFDIEYTDYFRSDVIVEFSGFNEVINTIKNQGVSTIFTQDGLKRLAIESVPKVVNDMIDAKDELQELLRNTIHEFTAEAAQKVMKSIIKTESHNPTLDTVKEDTQQLLSDCTVAIPEIKQQIDSYFDDYKLADVLMDGIQDLLVQTYEHYYNEMKSKAVTSEQKEKMEDVMEVDALVVSITDLMGK